MTPLAIKIKRTKEGWSGPLPAYASAGASGMDIRAALPEDVTLAPGQVRRIPTGLSLAVPHGFEVQVRPRSGLAMKHGIGLVNSPGTIDADYRGEIGILLINWGEEPFVVRDGDRIAQLVVARVYRAELVEVDRLEDSVRGTGGFGHTGIT